MDTRGSTFIVTGGASGLGAATARMLVQGGANVVLADLKDVEGRVLAAELGAAARYVQTNVADDASAVAAVAAAAAQFGGDAVGGNVRVGKTHDPAAPLADVA